MTVRVVLPVACRRDPPTIELILAHFADTQAVNPPRRSRFHARRVAAQARALSRCVPGLRRSAFGARSAGARGIARSAIAPRAPQRLALVRRARPVFICETQATSTPGLDRARAGRES